MSIIRAHFDGKVFVPEEPVGCPTGASVRLILISPEDKRKHPLADLARMAESFPDDPDWPSDDAAECDQSLYGTPKRGQ